MSAAELEAVACEAVHLAGRLLRERFLSNRPLVVETKGVHDFVTEIDRASEEAVCRFLEARFPDHAILAEERAPAAGVAPYRWVIDPLDGTTNFIHGVPFFAVAVAVEDRDGPLAAAILDPLRDETFHGHRGGGARLDGRTIRCSVPGSTHSALIATGFPFRELARLDRYLVAFEAFVRSTAGIRRAGSACLDLAYTACGRFDGFWEIGLSRWDLAAGALLVREAGGRVTDVLGGDGYLESGDIVAAGPRLHRELLAVTRRAFSDGAEPKL
jgi:myo-inositol-1(or 4)-monophosphatase